MFTGSSSPLLDDKGRLVLPAKFRDALAEGTMLTKGQERSITVWPLAEFAAYADRLKEASASNPNVRSYLRVLFSTASEQKPDRQGRITIPRDLREFASIDRQVVVNGNNTTVEIWNVDAWQTYLTEREDDFADLSEEVIPGLI